MYEMPQAPNSKLGKDKIILTNQNTDTNIFTIIKAASFVCPEVKVLRNVILVLKH